MSDRASDDDPGMMDGTLELVDLGNGCEDTRLAGWLHVHFHVTDKSAIVCGGCCFKGSEMFSNTF